MVYLYLNGESASFDDDLVFLRLESRIILAVAERAFLLRSATKMSPLLIPYVILTSPSIP